MNKETLEKANRLYYEINTKKNTLDKFDRIDNVGLYNGYIFIHNTRNVDFVREYTEKALKELKEELDKLEKEFKELWVVKFVEKKHIKITSVKDTICVQ